MSADPTRRFTSRVGNYVKYRPGYPLDLIPLLRYECGLTSDRAVADIGSGTGILSKLLLDNGNTVYAVEPNPAMRQAAESLCGSNPRFHSVDGAAEATTLSSASVDLVTAGQAFHWFDPKRARTEVQRILRPSGWTVILWNDRRSSGTRFLEDYEKLLLRFGTDYAQVSMKYADANSLREFFQSAGYRSATFDNYQELDFEGLQGRLLSSSYTPEPGHPDHQPMLAELRRIFDAHQQRGLVTFEYDTKVFYGQFR